MDKTISNIMDRLGEVFLSNCNTDITLEEFLNDEVLRNDIKAFLNDGWLPDEIFKHMKTWEDVYSRMDEKQRFRLREEIEADVSKRKQCEQRSTFSDG